jgi:FtsZ-binding cell division protein ZapB
MPSTYDKFGELETRITRTVDLVKTLRAENARLERENQELRRERDLVKNKVESLLENLAELTEESVV